MSRFWVCVSKPFIPESDCCTIDDISWGDGGEYEIISKTPEEAAQTVKGLLPAMGKEMMEKLRKKFDSASEKMYGHRVFDKGYFLRVFELEHLGRGIWKLRGCPCKSYDI